MSCWEWTRTSSLFFLMCLYFFGRASIYIEASFIMFDISIVETSLETRMWETKSKSKNNNDFEQTLKQELFTSVFIHSVPCLLTPSIQAPKNLTYFSSWHQSGLLEAVWGALKWLNRKLSPYWQSTSDRTEVTWWITFYGSGGKKDPDVR